MVALCGQKNRGITMKKVYDEDNKIFGELDGRFIYENVGKRLYHIYEDRIFFYYLK
jgi:hypothetical protein